ncbi:tetratricopeptide repeat protein 36 [Nerophis ophidion]|uniref:tetratricopeptide repeat protein 36 n=1 Tax=Nerophis ophidion TaxID=159077 RepID=UPI002AE032FA|nr:tetratricopeptide repeat protein 36 [Nerophis ophidion]
MASAHDRAVLQAIFSPNSPFEDVPQLEVDQDLMDEDASFDALKLREVKDLEGRGVSAAEDGRLQEALHIFSQAIQILPQRPSAYNNRAQTLRLLGDTAGALEDLERAMSLSTGAGVTSRQVLVQRGLVYRLQGQEDSALADFQKAAALGSVFARRQLVNMNPYAALCNSMLAQVVQSLCDPQVSDTGGPVLV